MEENFRQKINKFLIPIITQFKYTAPLKGGKKILDNEYKSGVWDYLSDIEEIARFSLISGYCNFFKKKYSILEIGCGAGNLISKIPHYNYSKYVGVDISEEVISRAKELNLENTFFVCEGAENFSHNEKFDYIIFSECLQYFEDPVLLIEKYKEKFLNPDGYMITSMYSDLWLSHKINPIIKKKFNFITESIVKNKNNYEWTIIVFR